MAKLVWSPEDLFDVWLDLVTDKSTIGRSRKNTFTFRTPTLSAVHAAVMRDEGVYTILDMGSTNGVRVNGRPVKQWELHHGDQIQLGEINLRFEDSAENDEEEVFPGEETKEPEETKKTEKPAKPRAKISPSRSLRKRRR